MLKGGCHCGAVRFETPDAPVYAAICHCEDCRRQSGAPYSAWAMVPRANLEIEGEPTTYRSSETGERDFCPTCGTGLFFGNDQLRQMGMVQVRIAALDEPDAIVPTIQVQAADQVAWIGDVPGLRAFERFPSRGDL